MCISVLSYKDLLQGIPPLSLSGKPTCIKPLENREFNGSLESTNETSKSTEDVSAQTFLSLVLPMG